MGRLLFRVIVFYGAVMAGFSTFDIIMAKYRVKSKLFGPIFPPKLPDKVQNEKAGFGAKRTAPCLTHTTSQFTLIQAQADHLFLLHVLHLLKLQSLLLNEGWQKEQSQGGAKHPH